MKEIRRAKARLLLARNVRRLRVLAEKSQEQVAEEAGLHRTYVSQVENCRLNVSLDTLDKLAGVLGVPLAELFDEETARSK